MKLKIDYQRTVGINESKGFTKKKLANYTLNTGLSCGHQCQYCSSPGVLRLHPLFKNMSSYSYFQDGGVIVDSNTPNRIGRQAKKLGESDVILFSSTSDPYAPEAQEHNLGRRCAEIILKESKATLRVLTKNAAVEKDFDLFAQSPGRVIVGLSVTALPSKQNVIDVIEPNASPIAERLAAYEKANEMGIRTFGMLCPLLPELTTSYDDISELVETMLMVDAEAIWVEPVNNRGRNLPLCQKALKEAGMEGLAYNIEEIRSAEMHTLYTDDLIDTATNVARDLDCLDKLKILVYGKPEDHYCKDDTAVIWL